MLPGKAAWFAVLVLSTVYAYIWDITMDWGLLQKHREAPWWRRYRIRDERIYPYLWVYYTAAVLNLLGRLAWALTITPHSVLEWVPRSISATTIAVMVSVFIFLFFLFSYFLFFLFYPCRNSFLFF